MIYIVDGQSDEILDTISVKNIIDDTHRKSMEDTLETYDFIALGDFEYSKFLHKRNKIIIPDEDGSLREFIITEVEKYVDTEGRKAHVYSDASYLDLRKANVVYPNTFKGSPSQHVGRALVDTGWDVGKVELAGEKTITISGHISPYENIKQITTAYGGEFDFRVYHNGRKITSREVNIVDRIGDWTGRMAVLGSDVIGIRRIERQDIVTALLGLGPEKEDGTRVEALIEDSDALQRWGRVDKNGNLQHLIEVYEIESEREEMTLTEAKRYTKTALEKRINTQVSYECEVVDLEHIMGMENKKIRFGDTIRVKDTGFIPPLYVEARVYEMERSIKTTEKKLIKLGDYIEYSQEDLRKIFNEYKNSLNDRLKKLVSSVILSSKGDVFKNGVGDTTLTAVVLMSGIDVTDNEAYTMEWTLYNGNLEPKDTRAGKSVLINDTDMDGDTLIAQLEVFRYEDSISVAQYTITNMYDGVSGEDGYTPVKGIDYFDGVDGQDGESSYLWIKYADTLGDDVMTDSPLDAVFIGIATTVEPTEPTNKDDYDWSFIKGTDGIQGEPGENGKSSYLHIKYSNDGGATFTGNNGEEPGEWIGTYVDFTEADSNTKGDYTWNKVKGERGDKGDDGYTPIKGTDYFDGVDGQDGVDGKSSYLWVRYSNSSDGTGFNTSPTDKKYIGVSTTETPSAPTNKTAYEWSLIKGTDGVKGETGSDGKTSYLHIKYSNNGGTSFTSNNGEDVGEWIGTYVDFIEEDSNSPSKYTWNKVKGEKGDKGDSGPRGAQGLQGPEGRQGIPGEKGVDGKTSYTHIAYADSSSGAGFSQSPEGKSYIGMYVDFEEEDSDVVSDYNWSLIKGADGAKGVAGTKGADGKTPYFHTAWANSSDGVTGFSTTVSTDKLYLGTYTDFSEDDSEVPSKYSWTKIKGDKGDKGDTGARGVQGLQGADGSQGIAGDKGEDGLTSYTHIAYADSATGAGFSQSPTGKAYIGMYADFEEEDSTVASKYKWSLIKGADGAKGVPGTKGADGKTPYFHTAWANNATGSGFSTTVSTGKLYIGTYTDFLEDDSESYSKYNWTKIKGDKGDKGATGAKGAKGDTGIPGTKGADGKTYYTWVKYASTPTTGMSTSPTGKDYMGIAYNMPTATMSDTYSDYTWSLYKGPQGVKGDKGTDGKTTYTWVKYANDSNGAGMSDSPTGKKYIGMAFNKTTSTESSVASNYTWSLMPQNIEIGGRNLLRNSKLLQHKLNDNSLSIGTSGVPEGIYTISFDYEVITEGVKLQSFLLYSNVADMEIGKVPLKKEGENRTSLTFEVTSAYANQPIMIYANNGSAGSRPNVIDFIELKLEKGNKATDWSPAPEDVEQEIIDVRATADGKNSVIYATTTPSTTNRKVGDVWFKTNDGNKMHRFTGSSWVVAQFGENAIVANSITANHIKSLEGLNVNDQFTVDSSGNVTFGGHLQGASGKFGKVQVTEGDLGVIDPLSGTEYNLIQQPNLILDHGFEIAAPTNTRAGYDIDFPLSTIGEYDSSSIDNHISFWDSHGTPKIVTSSGLLNAVLLDGQSMVVNSSNYVYQDLTAVSEMLPAQVYTLSGHFKTASLSNKGRPRIRVEISQSGQVEFDSGWKELKFNDTSKDNIERLSYTFLTPPNVQFLNDEVNKCRVTFSAMNSNWVMVDGVQLVQGARATAYDRESGLWNFLAGGRTGQFLAYPLTDGLRFQHRSGAMFDKYGNIRPTRFTTAGSYWNIKNVDGDTILRTYWGSNNQGVSVNDLEVTSYKNALWTGAMYPLANHTITPSKKLTDCTSGWVLRWQRYTIGSGTNNSNFSYSIVHKSHVTEPIGTGVRVHVPISNDTSVKYIYITDSSIKGHDTNNTGVNNTSVLSAVFEF